MSSLISSFFGKNSKFETIVFGSEKEIEQLLRNTPTHSKIQNWGIVELLALTGCSSLTKFTHLLHVSDIKENSTFLTPKILLVNGGYTWLAKPLGPYFSGDHQEIIQYADTAERAATAMELLALSPKHHVELFKPELLNERKEKKQQALTQLFEANKTKFAYFDEYAAAALGATEWIQFQALNVNQQDKNGLTMLHWAVLGNQAEVVELLCSVFKADANIKDPNGRTPLHYAAHHDRKPLVRLLLQHGAAAKELDSKKLVARKYATQNSIRRMLVRAEYPEEPRFSFTFVHDVNPNQTNEDTWLFWCCDPASKKNVIKKVSVDLAKESQVIENWPFTIKLPLNLIPKTVRVIFEQESNLHNLTLDSSVLQKKFVETIIPSPFSRAHLYIHEIALPPQSLRWDQYRNKVNKLVEQARKEEGAKRIGLAWKARLVELAYLQASGNAQEPLRAAISSLPKIFEACPEVSKYLRPEILEKSASGRDLTTFEAPDVLSARIFTQEFCEKLLSEVSISPLRASDLNIRGVHLDAIGLGPFMERVAQVLTPLARAFDPTLHALHHKASFVIQYSLGSNLDHPAHQDQSHVTLNLCLLNQLEGGELLFTPRSGKSQNEANKTSSTNNNHKNKNAPVYKTGQEQADGRWMVEHREGVALIHSGSIVHEALPVRRNKPSAVELRMQKKTRPVVSNGVRTNLVIWLDREFRFPQWSQLPTDTQMVILSFLPFASISRARQSCRAINALASSDAFWKMVCAAHFGITNLQHETWLVTAQTALFTPDMWHPVAVPDDLEKTRVVLDDYLLERRIDIPDLQTRMPYLPPPAPLSRVSHIPQPQPSFHPMMRHAAPPPPTLSRMPYSGPPQPPPSFHSMMRHAAPPPPTLSRMPYSGPPQPPPSFHPMMRHAAPPPPTLSRMPYSGPFPVKRNRHLPHHISHPTRMIKERKIRAGPYHTAPLMATRPDAIKMDVCFIQ